MAIGMTYEEYWYGDVRMTGAFLEADRLRKKQLNTEMWIQGRYVYDAVGRLAPIFKFGVKNPKPIEYPSEPYKIFKSEEEKAKEKEEKENSQYAENERLRAILYFRQWAKANSNK